MFYIRTMTLTHEINLFFFNFKNMLISSKIQSNCDLDNTIVGIKLQLFQTNKKPSDCSTEMEPWP